MSLPDSILDGLLPLGIRFITRLNMISLRYYHESNIQQFLSRNLQ
jgi:hypothetical protein